MELKEKQYLMILDILPVNALNFFKTEGEKKTLPVKAFSEKYFSR